MDIRVRKLRTFLDGHGSEPDIIALVEAGYDTPRKIKAATDEQLLAVPGIGAGKLAALRQRCPFSG
jgi:hypothetical protein